jgi:hypothetical protein
MVNISKSVVNSGQTTIESPTKLILGFLAIINIVTIAGQLVGKALQQALGTVQVFESISMAWAGLGANRCVPTLSGCAAVNE